MTVEVRVVWGDGYAQFVLGHGNPVGDQVRIAWDEFEVEVDASEVFTAAEASPIFEHYFHTATVPEGLHWRRILTGSEAHVWIALEQEDGFPPFSEEQLHTRAVGGGLYELLTTPVFARGVAVGDLLAVTDVDGELWATEVAAEGDHWCGRVVALGGFDEDRIAEILVSMGATVSPTPYGVLTFDASPDVDAEHFIAELDAGVAAGDWDYDLSVAPTLHGEATEEPRPTKA